MQVRSTNEDVYKALEDILLIDRYIILGWVVTGGDVLHFCHGRLKKIDFYGSGSMAVYMGEECRHIEKSNSASWQYYLYILEEHEVVTFKLMDENIHHIAIQTFQ